MGHTGVSPSLKVQSWLRMEPNASSFDSVASSATRRSTYTIICFSWSTKTCFSDNSQNTHWHVSKVLLRKWSWAYAKHVYFDMTPLLWNASSSMRPDGHFDLQVCFISWILFVMVVLLLFSTADVSVYTLFFSFCSFSTIFLSRNRFSWLAAKEENVCKNQWN